MYEGSFFLGFEGALTGRLGGVLGGDPKSSSSLSVSQAFLVLSVSHSASLALLISIGTNDLIQTGRNDGDGGNVSQLSESVNKIGDEFLKDNEFDQRSLIKRHPFLSFCFSTS